MLVLDIKNITRPIPYHTYIATQELPKCCRELYSNGYNGRSVISNRPLKPPTMCRCLETLRKKTFEDTKVVIRRRNHSIGTCTPEISY